MEYILFAFLACISDIGNALLNKFVSNTGTKPFVINFLKSTLMVIGLFIIVLIRQDIKYFFDFYGSEWIYLIASGIAITFNAVFYWLAIKTASIDAMTPYQSGMQLFFNASLYFVLFFSNVTNGNKPLNIVIYTLSILFIIGAELIVFFSKSIHNGKSKKWMILSTISALGYALSTVLIKVKMPEKPSEIIMTWQFLIQLTIGLIILLFLKKELLSMKKIKIKTIGLLTLNALTNIGLTVFTLIALSYENANPSIVTIVSNFSILLIVIIGAFAFKEKLKKMAILSFVLILIGMVFVLLAGIL